MCNTCDKKSRHKSNKERRLNKKKKKCPEDDEKTKKLPKCPSPKRRWTKIKKCLTEIEKIMLRIQPSIADREKYLHPEHVNCFLEESERVTIKKPKCAPCPPERPRTCGEDKKKRKKKKKNEESNENAESEKPGDEKAENQKENDAESGAVKQEGGEMVKVEKDKEKSERRKTKGQIKRNKKKKSNGKRKHEDIEDDSDSEMSICSNDSEVCLVGLGLTKEDKKQIEENRRKVHPPPDNSDVSAEAKKDTQELEIQEDGDKL